MLARLTCTRKRIFNCFESLLDLDYYSLVSFVFCFILDGCLTSCLAASSAASSSRLLPALSSVPVSEMVFMADLVTGVEGAGLKWNHQNPLYNLRLTNQRSVVTFDLKED